jgi:hypothetical protein
MHKPLPKPSLALLSMVVAASLVAATHTPPVNVKADVGDMQCNTSTHVHDGQVPRVTVSVVHSDNGHMAMNATGSALGSTSCTFQIKVTDYTYGNRGFSGVGTPNGTVSNELNVPCVVLIPPGTCDATHDFDWTIDFVTVDADGRHLTTDLFVHYELQVTTVVLNNEVTTTVANGTWDIFEPSIPRLG